MGERRGHERARSWYAAGALLGAAVGACLPASAFVCTSDTDCVDGAVLGLCEPTSYCSFPDAGCDGGRRYGRHADEHSGQCLPTSDDSGDTAAGPDATDGPPSADETGATGDTGDAESGDVPLTGGVGESVRFVDDDEHDFSVGTILEGVRWSNGGLELDGGPSGWFASRIFDAGEPVTWHTLEWIPRGPYGKPLPSAGVSEQGYAQGGADMTANLLLLPLDGEQFAPPQSKLLDMSGDGHDFTVVSNDGVPFVDGVFGSALADDLSSYARHADEQGIFSFGEDDFTWSMWIETTTPCDGDTEQDNRVFFGMDGEGSDRSHLWLGCRHAQSLVCDAGGPAEGRLGGTVSANHAEGGPRLCGSSPVLDDQWHHLAFTKSGHADAVVRVYLDGALEATEAGALEEPVEFPLGTELALGAFSGGGFPSAITVDELAVWRRALSTNEVEALFQRGARQLRIQVRACDDPTCSDALVVGPDGTPSTSFADVEASELPGTVAALPPGLNGRYFQYQVWLDAGTGSTPTLEAVVLDATP